MLRPAGIILGLGLASLALAACGGGGGTTVSERTVPASGTTAARPTLEASSGFPEVDAVIQAALAQDELELAGLTGYQMVPCGSAPDAGGGLPCRESEAEGQEVEALAVTTCEDGWIRPEDVSDAYTLSLAPGPPELVAVYTPRFGVDTFGGGFGATAVAVFRTGSHPETEQTRGTALYINSGRTVWIRSDCNDLIELLDPAGIDTYLIAPAGGEALPSTTPAPQ
jgi:hypothetical protein